jgi:hypothetical protein
MKRFYERECSKIIVARSVRLAPDPETVDPMMLDERDALLNIVPGP